MNTRLVFCAQTLPEVSRPSKFYFIDSAITFKAENGPYSQENNSEKCRKHIFHHLESVSTETSETHLRMHTEVCNAQTEPTRAHTVSVATLIVSSQTVPEHPGCRGFPRPLGPGLPARKMTQPTKCFIAIILPYRMRLFT